MSHRNLKLVLVASLAANIFLIGGAAGAFGFWLLRPKAEVIEPAARPGLARQQAPRRPLRFAADELAPAQRQQFRQALRQAWRDSGSSAQEARDQRLALAELLGEPSPDRARIEAAMDRARTADIAVRARVEKAVADFAAGLSAQDRAVFVEGLKHSGTLRPAPRAATDNPPPAR